MLPPALHPLARNRPDGRFEIDLFPPGAARLAAPRRRQNCKLERRRAHALAFPQAVEKRGNFRPRHRRMMADFALLPARQQVVEIRLPTRGIQARAVAHGRTPVENLFDSATEAGSGFVLVEPQRPEHGLDVRRLVRRNQAAYDPKADLTGRCSPSGESRDQAGTYVSLTVSSPTGSVETRRSGGRGPAKNGLPRPSTMGWK
jgi:hypothetical protein